VVVASAVIDCSALVRALADESPEGEAVRSRLAGELALAAPSLLDYELMSALLGMIRGGKITPRQMGRVINSYKALDVARHETLIIWERVRDLNHNISSCDAQYVALAEVLELPLITCDARIKRSGAAKCAIEVFD
jgi:predicted nucleic acid-binding protein